MKMLAAVICILLPLVTVAQITDTGCGSTKACYKDPDTCTGADCTFFLSYAENNAGDATDFEMVADRSGRGNIGWAAVGFSTDSTMGSDSVVMCIESQDGTTVTVKNAYNVGETNDVNEDGTGLTTTSASATDGVISCVFTRDYVVTDNANFFNIRTTDYYFMMGSGPVTSGVEVEHEVDPVVTNTVIDITATDDFTAGASGSSSGGSSSTDSAAHVTPVVSLILSLCGLLIALYH